MPKHPHRSVARPFLILAVVTSILLCSIATAVVVRGWRGQRRSLELSRMLEHTIRLNDTLAATVDDHLMLFHRALEHADEGTVRDLEQLSFEAGRLLDRYLGLAEDVEERTLVETIRTLQAELALSIEYVIEMVRTDRRPRALAALHDVVALEARLDETFSRLSEIRSRKLRETLDAYRSLEIEVGAIVAGTVVMVLCCAGFVVVLRRRVLRPLDAMVEVADRVARGDYSKRLDREGKDELGWLSLRLNDMTDRLEATHLHLQRAVDQRTLELRQTQEQLVQSEKMSAVGRLVSGVAHELNNPLTAILGLTELARCRLPAGRTEVAEHLGQVLEQTERCRRIVADLLQFARQRETRREPTDLCEVVATATELYGFSARTREVELRISSACDGCVVLGDRYKLQQVILALLNNAVDSIAETPGAGAVEVRLRRDKGEAVIEVRDDGSGIEEPARVFEPFYTTKDVGRGTGLGLSICFGIVEEHGGRIACRNLGEGGACFTVRLPLTARPTVTEPPADRRLDRPEDPGRVLIVDDEEQVLRVEQAYLERLGFTCRTASDGRQAIALLEAEPVDLVISDLRMPGPVNGLELYRWVERHRPDLAARFLFATGDPAQFEQDAGRRLPGPCLLKPFGYREMAEAVRRVWRPSPEHDRASV